jgi:hypothetical protein
MDEHSCRATRTPDLTISVFELWRSANAYPQAELNLLTEEQNIHVSVIRIIGRISPGLSQFSYSDFLIYIVFIASLARRRRRFWLFFSLAATPASATIAYRKVRLFLAGSLTGAKSNLRRNAFDCNYPPFPRWGYSSVGRASRSQ